MTENAATPGFWAGALERQALVVPDVDAEVSRRAAYLSEMTGLSMAHALDKAMQEHTLAAQAAEAAAEKSRFRAAAGNPSHLQDEDADTCPFCGSELFSIGTRPVDHIRSQDPAVAVAQHRDPRQPATYHVRCSNFGCRYPLPVGDAAIGGGYRRQPR